MEKKFNWLAALFAATVLAFFAGCEAEADLVTDTTPPAKVTIAENAATAGNCFVLLSWTNPADEDFYAVKISFEPAVEGVTQPVLILGEKGQSVSHLVGGLTNDTKYKFSLVSLDKTLNESEAVTAECTPVYVADTTAPAVVTNLSAEAKSEAVVLTWSDPADEDLFGIEIAWEEKPDTTAAASIRSVVLEPVAAGTFFVAPGVRYAKIPNLTAGKTYTFTVKAMDTSGNKSEGVSTSATPLAEGETMKIALSSPSDLSNTNITVTVKITTGGTVEKVVYKKDGSISARELFADEKAIAAVQGGDNKTWTFNVTENGTYTVAALDSDGREETMQHTVNEFDFVAQNEVKNLTSKYENGTITFTWEIPETSGEYDSPYDHAQISYTSTDSSGTSEPTTPVKIENSGTTYTVENIDSSKKYYTFTVQTEDKLGNKSKGLNRLVMPVDNVPEGFVSVPGDIVVGATNENNFKGVFVEGRTVTLSPFYMSKYPVTKAKYKEIMSDASLNTEGITADPSYSTNVPKTYVIAAGENDDNRPVEDVTWYDAVYFCNLLSKKEGLNEVYTISDIQTKEAEITNAGADGDQTVTVKYILRATVTMDMTKNGYRLPTEAEWEYAARGGNPNAADWNYLFSGADTASNVKYSESKNSGLDAVGWYRYNTCNGGVTGDDYQFGSDGCGTHEVGLKKPNALGLYDMSGNVWEWCWDLNCGTVDSSTPDTGASSGYNRVCRGGSWRYDAYLASVYYREISPASRSDNVGFRLVRSAK